MTDQNPVLIGAQADQADIVDIGTVAAENLALSLNLPKEHVGTIKQAIKDEINAMSAHFTMAFADIRDQYELDLKKVKSTYRYVNANVVRVIAYSAIVFLLGVGVGLIA